MGEGYRDIQDYDSSVDIIGTNEAPVYDYSITLFPDARSEPAELKNEEIGRDNSDQSLGEQGARSNNDITWKYLKDLGDIPVLTRAQEMALAKKIREGEDWIKLRKMTKGGRFRVAESNGRTKSKKPFEKRDEPEDATELAKYRQVLLETQKAKDELIQANLRLVVNIAKRFANRGFSLLDLIQEGNLGLLKAVARFDYTKGYRFSTYATWWIKATIGRAFAEKLKTIRLPSYLIENRRKVVKSRNFLAALLGREPNVDELFENSGVCRTQIEKILTLTPEPISLNTPIGEEDRTIEDIILDEREIAPSDSLSQKDLSHHIRKLLVTCLSPREKKILCLRFGIGVGKECTLEEIGMQFGLTRERIRQIEARAIERLRDTTKNRTLKEYFE